MKILAISDKRLPEMERKRYLEQTYGDVDLLVSCGDLEPAYLEFVTTVLNVPLFFVRGNHDTHYAPGRPGGDDLHLKFLAYNGVTLAGLEGSVNYNTTPVKYSQLQMQFLCLKMLPRLLMRRMKYQYGVDFLVTHSPPMGIHDRDDYAHQGFAAFLWLMRLTRPRFLIHGHIDIWDRRAKTETDYFHTKVININPKRLFIIEPEADMFTVGHAH